MRSLRHVEPGGQFFEITTRTVHSRFLLRPSRRINEIILGILGRALALFPGVQLFAFAFLSNHYHLVLWAPDELVLSRFMSMLNGVIARKVGRVHEWRDRFWSRRFEDIAILDEKALLQRIEYVLANGVKENLVASPFDWPGPSAVRALTHGETLTGVWEDASAKYIAARAGKKAAAGEFRQRYEVRLAPFPAWRELTEVERQARYRAMVARIEKRARLRNRLMLREPLGADKVLRQHPHDRPSSSKASPAPWCHTSTRSRRVEYCAAMASLRDRYRDAARRLRAGERTALGLLPRGCHVPPLGPGLAALLGPTAAAR